MIHLFLTSNCIRFAQVLKSSVRSTSSISSGEMMMSIFLKSDCVIFVCSWIEGGGLEYSFFADYYIFSLNHSLNLMVLQRVLELRQALRALTKVWRQLLPSTGSLDHQKFVQCQPCIHALPNV